MDSNTKHLETLFSYDFVNEVRSEEKDVLLAIEPDLFIIKTITLPKLKMLAMVVADAKIHNDANIGTNTKIKINMKSSTDEQIFEFPHAPREISVDTMPTRIKMQNMKMAKWNLSDEVQICLLKLGSHDKLQVVKLNVDLDSTIVDATKQLLKEYKNVFVWT